MDADHQLISMPTDIQPNLGTLSTRQFGTSAGDYGLSLKGWHIGDFAIDYRNNTALATYFPVQVARPSVDNRRAGSVARRVAIVSSVWGMAPHAGRWNDAVSTGSDEMRDGLLVCVWQRPG